MSKDMMPHFELYQPDSVETALDLLGRFGEDGWAMAGVAATLFLGGYWLPGVSGDALNFLGPIVILSKVMLIAFLFIWLRWTFPRLREDQLQTLAWKWLIPAGLINILVTAFFKVVF